MGLMLKIRAGVFEGPAQIWGRVPKRFESGMWKQKRWKRQIFVEGEARNG